MIFPHPPHSSRDGFSMLEVCIAVAIAGLLGAVVIGSMVQSMSFAATARLMTNARTIVHRNIDAASGVAFPSTSSQPPLLTLTSNGWSQCEDDGDSSGTLVENIQLGGTSNSSAIVTGTLSRKVTQETVSECSGAVVYRVTFKVDYTFLSKNFSYAETTLRSIDSNN